jgi:polyhydroxyalkanoate synthase
MTEVAQPEWSSAVARVADAMAKAMTAATFGGSRPYDPLAAGTSVAEFAGGMMLQPARLLQVQFDAARQWGAFWTRTLTGAPTDRPRDRRFAAPAWQDDPWYRTTRDAYLLASEQLRGVVETHEGNTQSRAMVRFLLDQYLNAIAPSNFAATNPQVVERTLATGGANLVQGFAHLIEDLSSGKGIVRRRSDPSAFVKGETIAATPGEVVFQNDLFQLIQYTPTTAEVAAEPLLYVPPLVNRYYMVDLQPRSSLVKWLVDQGRTVFVISWVNPGIEHRDKAVEDYVREGIIAAISAVHARTEAKVDLFAFCLGGTLVAIALADLAAREGAGSVNSATLIGSMIDFADMRDWSAFVHEAHLDALDAHLAKQGYIESTELQQLFAAMRANDLIWSSVINHYLLDQPAPPSDLLYWFEDGARIPAAFLTSYNRKLLSQNALTTPAGFEVRGVPIDLAKITAPILSIALKDDHVSAWSAVYDGARMLNADFVLGGSGHNAGVINPPSANKHGFWTGDARPEGAEEWLAGATRHEGSWWPHWIGWLDAKGSGKRVPARVITDAIEAAPGAYARMA